MMRKYIPLSVPNFEGNEKAYVADAIDSTYVSTVGAYVPRLEKSLASFLKVANIAVCQSGTSALHLSMVEAGVKPGDIVLVPSLTFIAAVNPVKYQCAIPVFMDCDDSLCIDAEKLGRFCADECMWDGDELSYQGHVVKAIVAVHVFGNMANMETIMDTAQKYHLKVIEDASEALGTYYTEGKYKGKYAGTIGDFGCYSFNGNKIITTGGGGAVTASKQEVVEHLRFLSTQAKSDPHAYVHDEVGYNYRMTNLQAALGVAQMEKLPVFIRRKQDHYKQYQAEFAGFGLARLMPFRERTCSNQWFYSLEVNRNQISATICEMVDYLHHRGIETRPVWGLINEQKPYQGERAYQMDKAPYYAERILNLPSSTQITEEEISYVVDEVKRMLRGMANG